MIKLFVNQNNIKNEYGIDSRKYNSGRVYRYNDEYVIAYQTRGAEETFSVGQPVYDKDKNLLGYMGIGLWDSLNYAHHPNGVRVPIYYWRICLPTVYCKDGIQIYTYWQNFDECEKAGD